MYIYKSHSIFAQDINCVVDATLPLTHPQDKCLLAIEPTFESIPPNILRRMGKAVRMGVGCGLPLIEQLKVDLSGIIIGTAHGGMEDCIRFLNQIVEYDEGVLTPTNFVQSTHNAIAAQLGLLSKNNNYNTTHVQKGLAFENALLDALMWSKNNNGNYLIGGLDEISEYNYTIECLTGWYKDEFLNNMELYQSTTRGTIAGEGASMFLVGSQPHKALGKVHDVLLLHSSDLKEITRQLYNFLEKNNTTIPDIDSVILGENGDIEMHDFYQNIEILFPACNILRYKHLSGEYPTVSALSLNIALQLLKNEKLAVHMYKKVVHTTAPTNVLIYNTFRGEQHGFVLVSK